MIKRHSESGIVNVLMEFAIENPKEILFAFFPNSSITHNLTLTSRSQDCDLTKSSFFHVRSHVFHNCWIMSLQNICEMRLWPFEGSTLMTINKTKFTRWQLAIIIWLLMDLSKEA